MTQRTAEARGGLQSIRESLALRTSMLVLAGLAITSCTSEAATTTPQIVAGKEQATDDSATLDGTMCPDTNAQAMQKVSELFAPTKGIPINAYDPNSKIETIDDIAARYGLTLHDFNDSLVKLRFDAEAGNAAIPFDKYLTVMNDFTNKYGVEVTVAADDSYEVGAPDRALTQAELESYDTKTSVVAIADGLFQIPEEFVRKIGLTKIVLMKIEHSTKAAEHISAFVDTDNPDTIYIDPTTNFAGIDLRHEMFHIWATRYCGSLDMFIDEDFNALNPQDVYKIYRYDKDKKGTRGSYVSREAIEERLNKLENRAFLAELKGNTKKQRAAEAQIAALKALVIADNAYGFSELAEDEATIGEDLLSPDGPTRLLDPEQKILRDKARLLLSRLYEYMPNMYEFYAEIGSYGGDGY